MNRKEFAAHCRITTRELAVYIGRKKVIVDDNGEIDLSDPTNSEFAEKKVFSKDMHGVPPVKSTPSKKRGPKKKGSDEKIPDKKHEDVIPNPIDIEKREKLKEKFDLDVEKKRNEVVKIKSETEFLETRRQKMLGKLIPTDVVKMLFAQHFKSVTVNFKQGIDILLVEIGKKAKLNRNDMALLKGSMTKVLNKSIEDAVKESKNSLTNLVAEHSQNQNH